MVRRPRDEVASCWYVPPAYEPKRMPAAVGDAMPVPPPPAPRRPARVLVKVRVFVDLVIVVEAVRPLKAVEEVAKTTAGPVAASFAGPIEVMPPPAPASDPQPNCPLDQVSLPDVGSQVESPAPKKLVVEAVVAKKLVVVAELVVPRRAVKFCRVEDPVTRRFESEERPPVAVRVVPTTTEPVKFAAEEIVWPFTSPEVMVPAVTLPRVDGPAVKFVVKRFVDDAVVEKMFVVVAKVVVPKPTERFEIVEDAERMSPRVVVGARYPFPCTEKSRKREV